MERLVRVSLLALLVGFLMASPLFVAAPTVAPVGPAVAGTVYASASPVVFGPETPANGSLLGLANPVSMIILPYRDVAPNATVVAVDFHLDEMNLTSAGSFNDTVFTLLVGFALRNGPHYANFVLVDSARNIAYHNWTFTVDTIPPVLIVTSPAYPAVPVSAIPVQGTAFPAMAAADPVTIGVTALPSHVSLAVFANNATGAFNLLMPLSEGTNVLFINATDAAGNLVSEIKTILSDTIKPALTVVTPLNRSVSPTSIVRVAGISEFGAYLTVNGFSVVVAPNGTWGVNLALPDGVNVIQVAAVDQVGNLNYAVVVVFVDSDIPRITLTAPLPALTNRSTIDLSGTVNDTKTVALFIRYNQNLRSLTFDPTTGYFATQLAGLPDGTYTIQVGAVDAAQRTAILTSTVVVDTTPPVVRLSLPPDGLETNQSTVHLVGTVDDPSASVLVNAQVVRPDGAGTWETTVALVAGSNTIRIAAVDTAGNRAAPLFLHVTYYSPYPGLANQTATNANNAEALAGFTRLALVGVVVLALGVELVVYMRMDRKIRETRRALAAVVQAMKRRPGSPGG
ncbi:MAG TPA: hypothetical protein VEY12_02425 [Thermoplasmata archaeon]|nr:hypothetical protein [Thermoplasmata archaeon]